MNWAWDQTAINGNEKLVLLRMADYADEHADSFPSYSKLANSASISRSTAMRIVSKLEQKGYIEKHERKRKNGSATSNIYRLNLSFFDKKNHGETDDPSSKVTPPPSSKVTPGVVAKCDQGGSTGATRGGSTGATPITTNINHHLKEKPDSKILPGNCQLPNQCHCKACKTFVNRIMANHKKLWAAKQVFDQPKRNTLHDHLAKLNTTHPVEKILLGLQESVENGEYRPGDKKPITAAIDAVVAVLDYQSDLAEERA